ncbi:MAG: hypothetical protein ACYC1M_14040 [Armatimonadota bacterium]
MKTRVYLSIASAIWSITTTAHAGEWVWPLDGTSTQQPVRSVAVNMSGVPANTVDANDCQLEGGAAYPDPGALGGQAVGAFGNKPGHRLTTKGVKPTGIITIYENNGNGRPQQFGLYINGLRKATLIAPATPNWYSPFVPVEYRGDVQGEVSIGVDEADVAANKNDFCMNIDRIEFSERRPSQDIWLPLAVGKLDVPAQSFIMGYKVKAPKGLNTQLVLEAADGSRYEAKQWNQWGNNSWENANLTFDNFTPHLDVSKLKTGVWKLGLYIRETLQPIRGTCQVQRVIFSDVWPSQPPAGSPFAPSKLYGGVRFTGRHAHYTQADTWYPSWASDGNLYSPYTDGTVDGVFSRSDNVDATTGMAKIVGDDPMKLKVNTLGLYSSSPWPFATRYPCGSLCYNGVWYYGTYILNSGSRPVKDTEQMFQGPFVGFRTSNDYGKTWTETPCTPQSNLFGERVDKNRSGGYTKIRMGTPHFVDFGKNMQYSPDGYAYLVAHGNQRPVSNQNWILGDGVYLCRVKPSLKNINDINAYQFFAGYKADGQPVWSHRFKDIKPLFTWNQRAGCVTMSYIPKSKRYIMTVSNGDNVSSPFNTYILESSKLTGPFNMVTYMEGFGRQAYFVNIPSKFIQPNGNRMWLCYSANWTGHLTNPPGASYCMNLSEFDLVPRHTK